MRKILSTLLCLGCLTAIAPIDTLAAPIIIKAATAHTSGTIPDDGYRALAEAINTRSNGRFKMEIYDNAKLGSTATAMQALQAGTIQMNMDASSQMTSFAPTLNIFDTPYLMPNYDETALKVITGPTTKKILEACDNKRMKFLGIFSFFPRFMETTRPVHSLEDAKGLKFRTTQSKMHVEIMKSFGMAPIPMTSSEVVTSLQQKVIEGVDYALNPSIALGYDTIAPYWAKWDHAFLISPICVNRNWWEKKLTEEDRQFLMTVITEIATQSMRNEQQFDEGAMQKLAAEGKPVFVPSAEEKARWIDAAKDVHKQFSKEFDPALVDAFRAEYNSLAK
jgi:TRAP-type C4-dicarboxylate transport system substrate-binding protein